MTGQPLPPLQVNRAPVLTLWATVVARHLGHPPDTALVLGRYVCGASARIKARRIGVADEAHEAEERLAQEAALKPNGEFVRLLGLDVPVTRTEDGTLNVDAGGKPTSGRSVRTYARAFGDRLKEIHLEMETLAASRPPEELNRVGFRLYEQFRPDAAKGAEGWGAKASSMSIASAPPPGCAAFERRHHRMPRCRCPTLSAGFARHVPVCFRRHDHAGATWAS